ncbi:MAG TPA: hydantoinase B/oxoprolinase family protein, partial [Terriglobia bacterium]|nr:hydantoinase B/oxoprolinase family protein [Terriglobia bacterium]
NTIEIDITQGASDIKQKFKKAYERIFGHWIEHSIEVESVRVITSEKTEDKQQPRLPVIEYTPVTIRKNIYEWESLHPGATIEGPALVVSKNSTTVVDKGWRFVLDSNNNALLTNRSKSVTNKFGLEAELELFSNRFTSVAYEMGAMLQRTSFSINVKERLDFSCAVLDRNGYLVVNAPHIPVHLGSLGVCVREVAQAIDINEGDVVITNHPAYGGSHLPDVTLIKGVFVRGRLVAYVANRAHHAEIGGRKPGSMPADATTLEEEGVIISPTYLVRGGKAMWDNVEHLFMTATWPTRLWDENRADLNGALAAVNYGEQAMIGLCEKFGVAKVVEYMARIREHAAELFSQKLKTLKLSQAGAVQHLDDGSPLRVEIRKRKNKLVIDFTGSSDVHPGNLNATRAIVQSVVLYVIRLLVDR